MIQTRKLSPKSNKVAVSFDPCSIYIRESGKEFFGKEELLVCVKEHTIFVSKEIADKFGLSIIVE